jgi:iron complex outermembrane receptor protein
VTQQTISTRGLLRGSTALTALFFGAGLIATPAMAQDATNQPGTQSSDPTTTTGAPTPGTDDQAAPVTNANEGSENEEIVVTGTLFRRTNAETPSPVTVLSAETLGQRGLNTVAEAVQRVSAGNAGTITQGWNTGFNFASGANAVSLRGLTVQSTLSIFDGLRMAPYPLADDGQRNFVDLNSIPNAIIDRIEVLRDGASSTYGADAVAGVINVITKKEIQGLHLNASGGIAQRGDAGEQRIDLTWGYGDLDEQGFNFYVSGEYQRQEELWARDRDYPFNSADLSRICNDAGSCMHDLRWNAITEEDGLFNGLISIPGVPLVRPGTAGAVSGAGRFSYLNPALGCGGYPTQAVPAGVSGTSPSTICVVDFHEQYIMLQPQIERKGLSARFTVNVGDRAQAYAMANYYRTDTFASFTPLGFNGTPTAPIPATLGAYNVMLPVYVCSTGVGTRTGTGTGCDAFNGVLNPNNPFAAQGQTAQFFYRSTRPRTVETSARALRGVLGVSGSFGEDWNYTAEFVASQVQLDRRQSNYLIPQRIMDVAARGTFNFRNPEANSQELWDFISPVNDTRSVSDLWQATATLGKTLFELPGGPLQVAAGLSYRKESIDAPSANPPIDFSRPLAEQYSRYLSINSVGTQGSRNVKSAFAEISAPLLDQLEFQLSGRYDKYSTGQKNFSPKVGAKFTPIPQLAIRGTYSKGFRIPSFNEAFGLPTTGFVTAGGGTFCTTFAAFCAAHGNNAFASTAFPVGLTQTGNPELDPEKSTSMTLGAIFEPIRNVSFTVDLWRIKVKNLIVGVTNIGPVVQAYYSNNGVVNIPGVTVLPGQPDPAFPNALPHIGFIQSSYQNADTQLVQGIDLGVSARFNPMEGVRLTSSVEASYLDKNHLTPIDPFTGEAGDKLKYEGTLSPCNVTSCSGSPQWRATWQNTVEIGDTTVSATAYYTSGYDVASVDFGATPGDCESAVNNGSAVTYVDGTPVICEAEATWNVDLTASHRINDQFTIYANVLNVLGIEAPFEPSAAYHIFQFNPAWAQPNIMGRYFRIGAKVDF